MYKRISRTSLEYEDLKIEYFDWLETAHEDDLCNLAEYLKGWRGIILY